VTAKRPEAAGTAAAKRKSGSARVPAGGPAGGHRARSLARRLAVQALYQIQMNPRPWQETVKQFLADPESDRADLDYFEKLIAAIAPDCEVLDSHLGRLGEIPPHELDPIEHAVLWLGLHELQAHPELPFRVALAEAVVDRAARELRPQEYGQPAA